MYKQEISPEAGFGHIAQTITTEVADTKIQELRLKQ